MTGLWSIIVPEATTNLLTNPNFETGIVGWTEDQQGTSTGSLAQSTAWSAFGRASLLIDKTGGSGQYGAYGTVDISSVANGDTITFSAWLYTVDTGTVNLFLYETGAAQSAINALTGPLNGRYEVTMTLENAPTAIRAEIAMPTANSVAAVYVDGAQVEEKAYKTTFCDGTRAGCEWSGAPHGSISTRSAQSRAGGRPINLDSYSTYITEQNGVGMPSINLLWDRLPLVPGGLFRGSRIEARLFTLQGTIVGSSMGDLHDQRRALLNVIKPDAVSPEQPVVLRYTLDSVAVDIPCFYDSGLEFQGRDGFTERVTLRLLAPDPFWTKESETAVILSSTQSVANADYMIARIDGLWQSIGTAGAAVTGWVLGPDNAVYAYGQFTTIGGQAANRIAKYINGAWSALGTGLNGLCYDAKFAPNGDLYVTGAFTTAGGGAANYIAYWDGSSWTALAAGLDDEGRQLAFGTDGTLYVCGNFSTVDGGTTADGVAQWDGSTWANVGGAGATTNFVWCIETDESGNVYAGGSFSAIMGVSATRIAKFNGTAWVALGSGANELVKQLKTGPDGRLYISGDFTTLDGVAAAYVGVYNGASFVQLGSGLDNDGNFAFDNETDLLYMGGTFTATGGGLPLTSRAAVWNGSAFAHLDVLLPGSTSFCTIGVRNANLYLAFSTTGTATSSAATTVTNNGTRTAYPKIVITRTGGTSATCKYLRNETTGLTLWLNYALQDGESLIIDLAPKAKRVYSTFYGDVWRAVLPGSDFGSFGLQPGANTIYTYVEEAGAPTVEAYLVFNDTYWGIDGVGV